MTNPLEKLIVTQPFGARPEYYKQFGFAGHEGSDFKTTNLGTSQGWFANFMGWQKLYAPVSGTVTVSYTGPYGTHIYLQDSNGNRFLFAHLKNARCSSGQHVAEGDIIGVTGSSGNAQGAHLHVSYRPKNFNINNGYFGNIDPMSVLSKKFVMNYTCFNTDSSLVYAAAMLLAEYSKGQIEVSPIFFTIPPISVPTLWTTEAQIIFLNQYPVSTPFAILAYQGYDPGHSNAVTRSSPGSTTILTAHMGPQTPLSICYEMANAIVDYLQDHGVQVSNDDIYIPSLEFIKLKVDKLMLDIAKL